MIRAIRLAAALTLLTLPGCAALQEFAALRSVTFAFERVSGVRVAGIPIGAETRYSSLGVADIARLGAAIATRQVPLELVAHVGATNPSSNSVAARLVDLDWTLFVEDRQVLAGQLGSALTIAPGQTADVPVSVRFDLMQLGSGGARDVFDLALAVAGQGSVAKEMRLELVPTIETSIGPIRYPSPVVVRRAATP